MTMGGGDGKIEKGWGDLALNLNIELCGLDIGRVSKQLVVWMGKASGMKAGWWIQLWEVWMARLRKGRGIWPQN
jgi:hypothetical protein